MICKNCLVAKGFAAYRWFNPACLCCGVRLIQHLGTLPISNTECSQRRRAVLDEWVAIGHNEAAMRQLVKGLPCIASLASSDTIEKQGYPE